MPLLTEEWSYSSAPESTEPPEPFTATVKGEPEWTYEAAPTPLPGTQYQRPGLGLTGGGRPTAVPAVPPVQPAIAQAVQEARYDPRVIEAANAVALAQRGQLDKDEAGRILQRSVASLYGVTARPWVQIADYLTTQLGIPSETLKTFAAQPLTPPAETTREAVVSPAFETAGTIGGFLTPGAAISKGAKLGERVAGAAARRLGFGRAATGVTKLTGGITGAGAALGVPEALERGETPVEAAAGAAKAPLEFARDIARLPPDAAQLVRDWPDLNNEQRRERLSHITGTAAITALLGYSAFKRIKGPGLEIPQRPMIEPKAPPPDTTKLGHGEFVDTYVKAGESGKQAMMPGFRERMKDPEFRTLANERIVRGMKRRTTEESAKAPEVKVPKPKVTAPVPIPEVPVVPAKRKGRGKAAAEKPGLVIKEPAPIPEAVKQVVPPVPVVEPEAKPVEMKGVERAPQERRQQEGRLPEHPGAGQKRKAPKAGRGHRPERGPEVGRQVPAPQKAAQIGRPKAPPKVIPTPRPTPPGLSEKDIEHRLSNEQTIAQMPENLRPIFEELHQVFDDVASHVLGGKIPWPKDRLRAHWKQRFDTLSQGDLERLKERVDALRFYNYGSPVRQELQQSIDVAFRTQLRRSSAEAGQVPAPQKAAQVELPKAPPQAAEAPRPVPPALSKKDTEHRLLNEKIVARIPENVRPAYEELHKAFDDVASGVFVEKPPETAAEDVALKAERQRANDRRIEAEHILDQLKAKILADNKTNIATQLKGMRGKARLRRQHEIENKLLLDDPLYKKRLDAFYKSQEGSFQAADRLEEAAKATRQAELAAIEDAEGQFKTRLKKTFDTLGWWDLERLKERAKEQEFYTYGPGEKQPLQQALVVAFQRQLRLSSAKAEEVLKPGVSQEPEILPQGAKEVRLGEMGPLQRRMGAPKLLGRPSELKGRAAVAPTHVTELADKSGLALGYSRKAALRSGIGKLKEFIKTVPEFKLDPTFTVETVEGETQFTFRDGGRYTFFSPEAIGLVATEELPAGSRIRVDLEALKKVKASGDEVLVVKPSKPGLRGLAAEETGAIDPQQAIRLAWKAASAMVAPARWGHSALRFAVEPLRERVARQAGRVGRFLGARALRAINEADRIRGRFAEIVLANDQALRKTPARRLTQGEAYKKGQVARASLNRLIPDRVDPRARYTRGQLLLEHKRTGYPLSGSKEELAWIKRMRAVLKIGAEEAGKAGAKVRDVGGLRLFRPAGSYTPFIRIPKAELLEAAWKGSGRVWEVLNEVVAKINDLEPKEAREALLQHFGPQVERIAGQFERPRRIRKMPTHIDVDGRIVELLEADPVRHMRAVVRFVPERLGFIRWLGQGRIKTRSTNDPAERYRAYFLRHGGSRTDFDNLIAGLHGRTLYAPLRTTEAAKMTFAEQMVFGLLPSVLRASMLTTYAIPNLTQTLSYATALAGPRRALRAMIDLTKNPRLDSIELRRMGAVTTAPTDWSLDPNRPVSDLGRIIFEMGDKTFGGLVINEFNERAAANMGRVLAQDLREGRSLGWKDRALMHHFDYPPANIERMMKGDVSREDEAQLVRDLAKTQFTTRGRAERSKWSNIPWVKFNSWFVEYWQGTTWAFYKAHRQVLRGIKAKDASQITGALGLLSAMYVGHALSGMASRYLLSLAFGRTHTDEPWYQWLAAGLFESMIPGPLRGWWYASQFSEGPWETVVHSLSAPGRTVSNVFSAITRQGRFADKTEGEIALDLVKTFVPVLKLKHGYLVLMGQHDAQMDEAVGKYWKWRDKNAPKQFPQKQGYDRFRAARRKFYRAVTREFDEAKAREAYDEALRAGLEKKDWKATKQSMKASLASHRLLHGLEQDQLDGLKRELGETLYQKLVTHDALMDAWRSGL